MTRIFLFLAALTLAACKQEIDLTLFTSDIVNAADTRAPTDVTATIRIEASTAESCATRNKDVQVALTKGFRNVEFLGCASTGMTTFAEYRVRLPVQAPDSASDSAIYVAVVRKNGMIPVILQIAPWGVDAITSALPNDLQNSFSGAINIAVTLTIQNDLPQAAIISVNGVFLDGTPQPQGFEISLPRRSEVRIALSDVGNAAFNLGAAPLFALLPQ